MTVPFHPLANLFPLIEGAEFDALVEDVRQNGVLEEIVLLDGMILDGRNRYRAGVATGLFTDENWKTRWEFVKFSTEGIDGVFSSDVVERGPLAFVMSKNLHRRHLNESQRAMVAARLATLAPGRPVQETGSIEPVSSDQAAEMLNVGRASVVRAKTVQRDAEPELAAAVDRGHLAVSSAAQASKLSPELQRQVVEAAKDGKANVVRTVIKKAARETREADLGAQQKALPDKRFGVILADPEWQFVPYSTESGMDRAPDNHYPTSDIDTIAERGVAAIAAEDSVLFLWVPAPMLPEGLRVMAAWGFTYKSHLVWNKIREGQQRGTGYWFTGEHELVLLGTRGNVPAPAPGTQWRSTFDAPVGEHSVKPDTVHELIEDYFPTLPKIELNARRARAGWDTWGFEAPSDGDTQRDRGHRPRHVWPRA